MHSKIDRFIDDRFNEEHPFRRERAGMDDFAKLMPEILNSSKDDLDRYIGRLDQLLYKNRDCISCTAKICVYLSIISKRLSKHMSKNYLKQLYELESHPRCKRNFRGEVYASLYNTSDCLYNDVPDLMSVDEMRLFLKGQLPDIKVPDELYCVLDVPGLLAGMRTPDKRIDWHSLSRRGFDYVVCLESNKPKYNPSPLRFLKCVELENLSLPDDSPSEPRREEIYISEIVDRAERQLISGKGIVVHCGGGRGRTGTVIGCILKRMRYKSRAIINFLHDLHGKRDDSGWPEANWQSQLVDRFV